ncbi:MAG: hypothetical protein HY046_05245 [Acidobacteria bacterium]|nr:hypothetical protein [Acidobacteriota bacterium]
MPPTRRVLAERGVPIGTQFSKGLREADPDFAELIVNMTGIPGKALFAGAKQVEDWDIADPYGEDMGLYRQICGEIEEQVSALAARLRGTLPETVNKPNAS